VADWAEALQEHVVVPCGLLRPRCDELHSAHGRCTLLDCHAGPHHGRDHWWWLGDREDYDVAEAIEDGDATHG